MGLRRLRRLVPLVAAAAAPLAYGRWARPRLLTWGATSEEVATGYPGDELVPQPDGSSTMATTLPGPPERVWAWLAQMGFDRAGWYSWDRLDRGGQPSSDRIVPEWQDLTEGQRLDATPDGQTWFTVAVADPHRTLVLRSEIELPSGHSLQSRLGPWPRAYLDGIWGFHLRPAPGGRTRLVVRTRGRGRPLRFTRPFNLLVGEPAHFIMQTRQFHNLRARVAAG
jgi:proline iminopeptidase